MRKPLQGEVRAGLLDFKLSDLYKCASGLIARACAGAARARGATRYGAHYVEPGLSQRILDYDKAAQ